MDTIQPNVTERGVLASEPNRAERRAAASDARRTNPREKRYLKKLHLTRRYGDCSTKTIDRMVEDGRLPPPDLPGLWLEENLDAHDEMRARAALERRAGQHASACE